MTTCPDTIPAVVYLRTGDQLQVIAFRAGISDGGLILYELALQDGSPLRLDVTMVERVWLEQMPAGSAVILGRSDA
ncbi:hypothetical protein ACWDWO_25945 [Actinopolymorpha singaporensis]|uniref:Uncharacterized protein n=1 Tax=Actinopolymorpha singaporensis TaxID=117157 RepID=A0A1H1MTW4_9ACTN|nr:hypothetical protein [Actinopolymorpha singaporensis]SDR90088.1 hypothetical protein SAMN04489717_0957 [Actinopolymorpha singaporensis]